MYPYWFFLTSDGKDHELLGMAKDHAKTLPDTAVYRITHYRGQITRRQVA